MSLWKGRREEGSKDRRDPAKIVFSLWAGTHKLILTTRAQVSIIRQGQRIKHLKPGYLDKHMYTLVYPNDGMCSMYVRFALRNAFRPLLTSPVRSNAIHCNLPLSGGER